MQNMENAKQSLDDKDKFAFGKNWQNFVTNSFSEKALENSKTRLADFLSPNSIEGKTFLDLGSGSGIHSLAALKLGAKEVLSIDYDQDSVSCTSKLKNDFGYSDNWQVKRGSILDTDLIKDLGSYDVVYCWGVAHHTGNMWKSLENIILPVKTGGLLFVAIYNTVEGRMGSKKWQKIKKFYNKSPKIIKKIMEFVYISYNFFMLAIKLNNPFSFIKKYKEKRGMSWKTDLIDWLGGYPYEHASVAEVFDFYSSKGFLLEKIKTTNYIGCNQFLFRKK